VQQVETILDSLQNLDWGHRIRPGRCQLYCKRESIELSAQFSDLRQMVLDLGRTDR
jgi:hypothetical protein